MSKLSEWKGTGVRVGTRTYGVAMGKLCKARMSRGCDLVYAMMREQGVAPDVAVYNMLMQVHVGSFDTVKFYWNVLNTTPPLKPDALSHITYLRAAARAAVPYSELTTLTKRTLAAVDATPQHRLVVYTVIAPLIPPHHGRALLAHVTASSTPDMRFYTALAGSCEQFKDEVFVEEIKANVERAQLRKDIKYYDTLLKVYRATKNFAKMLEVLKDVEHAKLRPTVTTYTSAIHTCCSKAQGDKDHPAAQLACLLFESANLIGLTQYATLFYAMATLHNETHNLPALAALKERAKTFHHYTGELRALLEPADSLL